ncbi:hypothetical protein [Paenirhodobacter sp. CAU 1674]|uniref:hypothetical protein n=1 Tax=Paenirhodobacter sp. CAU 1674 TaxID=3032596 RepID=UPI0023DA7543|nr:hypothetical protein [Paenirhodobacter sp. CAU 1674]MDF2142657.1 hypothetical protein [Paenirhodobacter sp. CAU 1674]
MNAIMPRPRGASVAPLPGEGPFSLLCAGETQTSVPGLGAYPVQTSVLLGRFRGIEDAMACAERRGAQRDLCADALIGFMPNLLLLQDARHRLCLAGQIAGTGLQWCAPVQSVAEVREVVMRASEIRARAMAALDRGAASEARTLRFQAAALEARLVDPAWHGRLSAVLVLAA